MFPLVPSGLMLPGGVLTTHPVTSDIPVSDTQTDTLLRLPIDPMNLDQASIVAYMNQVCFKLGQSSMVREFCVGTVLRSQVDNDLPGFIQDCFDFVVQNLKYVPDPEGDEYLISPISLIEKIKAGERPGGDCDDHVMLLNTLLQSIGFQTEVAAVKIGDTNDFNHVISSVLLDGKWMDLDPCAKTVEQPEYTERLLT